MIMVAHCWHGQSATGTLLAWAGWQEGCRWHEQGGTRHLAGMSKVAGRTCEVTSSLADIHRLVLAALPEAKELLCETKGGAQVLQGFWGALPQVEKQRG